MFQWGSALKMKYCLILLCIGGIKKKLATIYKIIQVQKGKNVSEFTLSRGTLVCKSREMSRGQRFTEEK